MELLYQGRWEALRERAQVLWPGVDEVCMSNLKPFIISFQPRPRAHYRSWVRFYTDLATAKADAEVLVEREFNGHGHVITVIPDRREG